MVGQFHFDSVEPKPQYYVIRMDGEGKAPSKYHTVRRHAYNEARRLARNNPGVEFIVAKKKASVKYVADLPIAVS